MKKILFLIPFLLLFSCDNTRISSITSSDNSSLINQKVLLSVYQVYEEPYNSNNWCNPRFDLEIKYTVNDIVDINSIKRDLRPQYQCYGDGYYWYENFWFNISPLEEAPQEFKITKNTTLYYGCRG